MSKFILVSDIHGNAPALEAVIEAEGKDAEYIILGDIHGLNPYPKRTLRLVQEVGNFVLAGNHDKAIFEYGEGHVVSDALSEYELRHTLSALNAEDVRYMLDLPHMEVIQRGSSRIAATHAFPWPEQASGYEPGNAGILKGSVPSIAKTVADDYDWVLHGHTHTQYDLDAERWTHPVHFVNPGSLGYDDSYSVVDTETGEVEHKSVDIDKTAIKEDIQEALPKGAPSVKRWY